MFGLLLAGVGPYLGPTQILFTLFGVFFGVILGVLPGLGALLGITLLTPIVIAMNPFTAIGILIGIFVGGTCGGAISAILLRIPGTPVAAATLMDGYPMAMKGEGPLAVGLAITSSAVGGIIGGIFLIFLSPALAKVSLEFAPPEYFALAFTGITCIAVVSKESTVKGLMAGALGLLLSTIGMDPFVSIDRFTFGTINLLGGFGLIPLVLGLFAFSEMFFHIEGDDLDVSPKLKVFLPPVKSLTMLGVKWKNILRSSTLGTFIGAVPGVGTTIAGFVSYMVAKNFSKNSEEYGTGIPDGVIAVESSNNACCGGALIPSLTLAIPGDPSSAMLLSALLLLGFIPGPQLFVYNQDMVGGIFWAYILSNFFLIIVGLLFMPLFIKILDIKKKYLIPVILLLCVIGTYSVANSVSDLWTMLVFGIMAFFLRKMSYPLAPFVIAKVLGPLMEQNFRRSLIMSGNDPEIFFNRPICLTIILINVLLLGFTLIPVKQIWNSFMGRRNAYDDISKNN